MRGYDSDRYKYYHIYISGAGTYPAKEYRTYAGSLDKAVERTLKRHRRKYGIEVHMRRLVIQVAWGKPVEGDTTYA